jgi:hypothetical protein
MPPPPQEPEPAPSRYHQTDVERARLKRRRKLEKLFRRRAEASVAPAPAPTASMATIGALQQYRSRETLSDRPVTNPVEFAGPDDLQRAIIFHEIFSAPKAMRTERELWD